MALTLNDILATGPLTIVAAAALLVLIVEAMMRKTETLTFVLAIIGFAGGLTAAVWSIGERGTAFGGMVTSGGFASFFAAVFCIAGLLSVLLSKSYIHRGGMEHGEYYALVLLAVTGMMLMSAAGDLITFFLGLEVMSVSFYILAGFARGRLASTEAALKYFLLGAFATGFLLYGIALLYGATGSTSIPVITGRAGAGAQSPLFLIGLALLMVGLMFKVAAVPFHMWVPDVYEGAPTTISAFMSTAGKAAAFSGFLLVFAPAVASVFGSVREVLALVAALSMILGNVVAIAQSSVKRMLAYSSIAHAGYIMTGVVAANATGSNGVLFYVLAYTFMNVGAFGVLSLMESAEGGNVGYDDYAGFSGSRPLVAALMAVFMFSLAGIPPFAGFFGKYYVFAGAVEAGYTWLAVVGVLMSVVSAYYYLRLVVQMYFKEGTPPFAASPAPLGMIAVIVAALALVGLGVYPTGVVNLTAHFF